MSNSPPSFEGTIKTASRHADVPAIFVDDIAASAMANGAFRCAFTRVVTGGGNAPEATIVLDLVFTSEGLANIVSKLNHMATAFDVTIPAAEVADV